MKPTYTIIIRTRHENENKASTLNNLVQLNIIVESAISLSKKSLFSGRCCPKSFLAEF
jgi:hypothetical protein